MTDQTPRTEAGLVDASYGEYTGTEPLNDAYERGLRDGAAQARTEGHENRWTPQELLDIYDRTADRPAIRAKIRDLVR